MRLPKLHLDAEEAAITPYGGLALVAGLARRLRLPKLLNARLGLFKVHKPYTEADHVLAQAYNLYVGGTCIEDMATLQHSEAVRRMLGAARLPDPTTGGDFLRRFDSDDLVDLDRAIDDAQEAAWRLAPRIVRRQREKSTAVVDLDSHIHTVYGLQMEGADFSHKGTWSYHPFVMSLAGTQEVLRLRNRPGNSHDARGALDDVQAVLPMLLRHFKDTLFRGDSQFYQVKLMDYLHGQGQAFAFVMKESPGVVARAQALPEDAWEPFETRAARARAARPNRQRRKRRPNLKRRTALARRKNDLRLVEQHLAEFDYRPGRSEHVYRVIVRRQRIDRTNKQGELFQVFRYRWAITNRRDLGRSDVIDLTYQRCDQENVIEQLQNGIASLRMPTGTLLANAAFLTIGRLAHNLKAWLTQLVLPPETVRWKWKRFRHAFVYVAATVIRHARQVHVRLGVSHRHHHHLLAAHQALG